MKFSITNCDFSLKSLQFRIFNVILQRQNPPRLFLMRTRAGLFVYIYVMTYTKRPISITDQIARLKSRGLTFTDKT